MTIWLTLAEYQAANLGSDTLSLKDGRYIGEMAVYHELHCIKRIRRHLHLEYYYPNLNSKELLREQVHIGREFQQVLSAGSSAFHLCYLIC